MSMRPLEKYRLDGYSSLAQEYQEALAAENILTVTQYFMLKPEEIMRITLMDHKEYERVADEIFGICRPQWTCLTSVLQTSGKQVLKSGISCLDETLKGGLYGGEILEFFGLPGSGKSQLCQMIAAYQCDKERVSVAYLDAKNDFHPVRFYELCGGSEEVLKNLCIFRGSRMRDVEEFISFVEKSMKTGSSVFAATLRLIIIDSLPVIFYPTITNADDSSRIFQEWLCTRLKMLATIYNLAVIVTNHAVADHKDDKSRKLSQRWKPALGQYWMNVPNLRVHLSSTSRSQLFSGEVIQSCRTSEGAKFSFEISRAGIL